MRRGGRGKEGGREGGEDACSAALTSKPPPPHHHTQVIKERDNLEAEAAAIKDFLTSPGPDGAAPPGLRGVSLVDDEGFPRADIDVWDVRVKRNRLACIETDHAELMKRIEELVQQLHQEAKAKVFRDTTTTSSSSNVAPPARSEGHQPPLPTTATSTRTHEPTAMEEEEAESSEGGSPKQAFALIDQVFRASPAEEAGMKAGDMLVTFGSVDAENHSNFTAIVSLVQNCVGRPVRVVVLRKGEEEGGTGRSSSSSSSSSRRVTLSLIPHTWSGRGLLGCHLTALSS